MLDSIYHMTLKLILDRVFAIYSTLLQTSLHSITQTCKPPMVYRF